MGEAMTWTHFHDMHSGGGIKEPPYGHIYIEAPKEEAEIIFYNRFGHSPNRVTCTCCGEDYSVSEHADLTQATGYERNLRAVEQKRGTDGRYLPLPPGVNYYLEPGEDPPDGYNVDKSRIGLRGGGLTLEEFVARKNVLVIRADEIKPEERQGSVPEQGYVWVD